MEAAIPAVIGAVGSLGAGAMNYAGASKAAGAANSAAALQQQRFGDTKAALDPFSTGGRNALMSYNDALGLNGAGPQNAFYANFQHDPGFDSAVKYGTDTINASMAAHGHGQVSGNQMAALQDWGQHSLSDAYHTRLSDLFNESRLGEAAGAALGGISTQSATAQGNDMITAGQYQGAGLAQLGAGVGGAVKTLASSYPSLAQKYYGSGTGGGYDPGWGNTYTTVG
jgi:hypothetical protein